jgi:hypothetical protein
VNQATQTVAAGGTITFSVTYTSTCTSPPPPPPAPPGAPSADIKANGSDGPVSVSPGSAVTIAWNSSNASSCSVSPTGWGGTSGSQSSGAINNTITYTLTCSGSGGSASDAVTVSPSGSGGSCGTMVQDSAVRGCSGYSEMSPVYQPSSAACSSYCSSQGANACEWNAGSGSCYVEYASGGCYVQPGFGGWYASVCGTGSTPTQTLTAQIWSGSGTITGSGISCPGICSKAFDLNSWVTVTAAGASGYQLGGWGGNCNSQTSTCTLRMDADKTALATFSPVNYSLSVTKTGSGSGTVTSSPGGINCGSTCSANYSYNTGVTLTATPASGSVFTGWSGDCAGTGSCSLTMSTNKSVGATFSPTFNYTLQNSGTASVTKVSGGNAYTQSTVSKVLTAGVTQAVTLSVSGVPTGVSYAISNNPCSPGCSSTITFTVSPTAAVGTYPITVTGSPLSKTTSFNLQISGAPISVTCSASPALATLNQPVTLRGTITGGTAPFTYRWTGTSITGTPNTNPYAKTYTTTGQKTAQLTVTDADGIQGTCAPVTLQVNFNPSFEEF